MSFIIGWLSVNMPFRIKELQRDHRYYFRTGAPSKSSLGKEPTEE
jgi:hypothetical protein